LSRRELMGNIFVYLLAGHETTAHTLAFALGLLACYPDEQQKLYDHIQSVLGGNRPPTYEDVRNLTRPLAVMLETLRLFPPIIRMPKKAANDTTLSIHVSSGEFEGQRKSVFIPKGSYVFLNAIGMHYNPRYWKDPYEFNPERFMSADWNKDAFLPFSLGARACPGRRFAEVEGVCILTAIVMRYKIELSPEAFTIIPGESPRATRERLCKVGTGITLNPAHLPLVFKRRD